MILYRAIAGPNEEYDGCAGYDVGRIADGKFVTGQHKDTLEQARRIAARMNGACPTAGPFVVGSFEIELYENTKSTEGD